jgi:hypothetical protein
MDDVRNLHGVLGQMAQEILDVKNSYNVVYGVAINREPGMPTLGDALDHLVKVHLLGKENNVDARYDDFLDSGISEFDNALYHFFFFGVQLIELRLVGISEASA